MFIFQFYVFGVKENILSIPLAIKLVSNSY